MWFHDNQKLLGRMLAALWLPLCCISSFSEAAPITPPSDQVVVEKLPSRSQFSELRLIERLRRQLQLAPNDDALALELVRAYFKGAMAIGDPRLIGYAQALLNRQFSAHQRDPQWWFVAGLLKQYGHDFSGALDDFSQTLKLMPGHAEAISWIAALYMVKGEYAKALQYCQRLEGLTDPLSYSGCRNFALAGRGQLRAAYQALRADYQRYPNADPELKLWILVRLGEMAERLGAVTEAEHHYQEALRLAVNDQYLLAAYTDFLLTQQRSAEVVQLLKSWEASDVLLLRLAIAANRIKDPTATRYQGMLKNRFDEAGKRGERLHEQEEARFWLLLENDPTEALIRALHNYQERFQREPRDVEMLLLAALAAKDKTAAQPVLRWLEENQFEDARLQPLLLKFGAAGS